jgi:regulator of sigma E protease
VARHRFGLMQILYSVLSFIVAIGVLVTVHEFGHYWVAKRLGVKVLRFSVGFGRPLLSRRAGPDDTEYVLAAVPLGGYVKMLDEGEGPVAAHERSRAFNRQSLWKRTAVVVAGPAANFLFAIVAYALMLMLGISGLRATVGEVDPDSIASRAGLVAGHQIEVVGDRQVATWESAIQAILNGSLERGPVALSVRQAGDEPRQVSLDLTTVSVDDLTRGQFFDTLGMEPLRPAFEPVIGEVTPGGAAERDGMRSGDRVVEANGTPIPSWSAWVKFVRARPNILIETVVERDGALFTLALTPAALTEGDLTIGRIGAGPAAPTPEVMERFYATVRLGPLDALAGGVTRTVDVSMLTLRMLWRMLLLEVSVKNLSGPISIAQYAGVSAQVGITRFLEFLAIVSVSLGILNLLPVPLLDGGHLLYYLAELVRGRPLSDEIQFAGQRIGVALLIGLMGLAFYNDLSRVFG